MNTTLMRGLILGGNLLLVAALAFAAWTFYFVTPPPPEVRPVEPGQYRPRVAVRLDSGNQLGDYQVVWMAFEREEVRPPPPPGTGGPGTGTAVAPPPSPGVLPTKLSVSLLFYDERWPQLSAVCFEVSGGRGEGRHVSVGHRVGTQEEGLAYWVQAVERVSPGVYRVTLTSYDPGEGPPPGAAEGEGVEYLEFRQR
ncbi:MAG: hypothetical protein HY722_05780 [Planctomycetes bacterium]|nr:hypothetical protein [Planctomycetota bacterium]